MATHNHVEITVSRRLRLICFGGPASLGRSHCDPPILRRDAAIFQEPWQTPQVSASKHPCQTVPLRIRRIYLMLLSQDTLSSLVLPSQLPFLTRPSPGLKHSE